MTTASRRPRAGCDAETIVFAQASVNLIRRPFHLRVSCFLGLILLFGVGLSSCGSDPKPGSARASVAPVVPVSVATAEGRDMPYYLSGFLDRSPHITRLA